LVDPFSSPLGKLGRDVAPRRGDVGKSGGGAGDGFGGQRIGWIRLTDKTVESSIGPWPGCGEHPLDNLVLMPQRNEEGGRSFDCLIETVRSRSVCDRKVPMPPPDYIDGQVVQAAEIRKMTTGTLIELNK